MPFDARLRLIAITDRRHCGGEKPLLEQSRALLDAGVRAILLREKDLPSERLLVLANQLRALTATFDALLLIHSDEAVARECGADGVHDTFAGFLQRSGGALIRGVSCHTREQLITAQQRGADYAFLSSVFAPHSKPLAHPPLGIAGLGAMIEGISLPIIALGGIAPGHVPALVSAGAAGVATIGGLYGTIDPAAAARDYVRVFTPHPGG
ncbi:MAG TPA: thiamine phosphate synthase [Candidatus Sumerlaeota bacterium]|nr:thiamine phosphate synthase [Candidatus Sumerlaeota bacterium]